MQTPNVSFVSPDRSPDDQPPTVITSIFRVTPVIGGFIIERLPNAGSERATAICTGAFSDVLEVAEDMMCADLLASVSRLVPTVEAFTHHPAKGTYDDVKDDVEEMTSREYIERIPTVQAKVRGFLDTLDDDGEPEEADTAATGQELFNKCVSASAVRDGDQPRWSDTDVRMMLDAELSSKQFNAAKRWTPATIITLKEGQAVGAIHRVYELIACKS